MPKMSEQELRAVVAAEKAAALSAFTASDRLSACSELPRPENSNEPENRLPPSFGTLLTRMPLLWISADSEPVL